MGMFDSVHARCPRCNGPVEFQTKSGDCNLDEVRMNVVGTIPIAWWAGLEGQKTPCKCGVMLELFSVTGMKMMVFVQEVGQDESF